MRLSYLSKDIKIFSEKGICPVYFFSYNRHPTAPLLQSFVIYFVLMLL